MKALALILVGVLMLGLVYMLAMPFLRYCWRWDRRYSDRLARLRAVLGRR
jgi:hypothetical protein